MLPLSTVFNHFGISGEFDVFPATSLPPATVALVAAGIRVLTRPLDLVNMYICIANLMPLGS